MELILITFVKNVKGEFEPKLVFITSTKNHLNLRSMSSHHIVRENQEPALIIANGEACSHQLMEQLLEWSPSVLVLDGAIERVMPLGIKIDYLLGDFDSCLDPEPYLSVQQFEVIEAPDQNKTDLEKGIEFLIAKGHQEINIIWATGRRSDHAFNNISSLVKYQNQAVLVMHDDYSKIFCLKRTYEKWYPKGTNLSLIPIGRVEGIKTHGLKYPLTNEELELGFRTGSNNCTITDGLVRISFETGSMLLMECWDHLL